MKYLVWLEINREKQTEKERNKQKIDKNGEKQTKMLRNVQKWTETDKGGKGRKPWKLQEEGTDTHTGGHCDL